MKYEMAKNHKLNNSVHVRITGIFGQLSQAHAVMAFMDLTGAELVETSSSTVALVSISYVSLSFLDQLSQRGAKERENPPTNERDSGMQSLTQR